MPKTKEIAAPTTGALDPQGLIGEILTLEASAEELKAQAKELQQQADAKRALVESALKALGLKSVKHESGYMAVMTKGQTKVAIADESKLLERLKENKLVLYVEKVPQQTIPEHERIRLDVFSKWLKTAAADDIKTMFGDAVIVEQKPDHLTINKPK